MKLIEIIGDLVKQLHHCWSCIRTAKQVTLYMQLQNKYVGHNERCLFCLQKTCKACNWARLLVTSGRSWDGSWVEIEWIAEAIVTLNLKPASHVWSEVSSYCISILFHPNVRFDSAIVFSRSPQLRAISARGPGWCRQKPLWRQAYAFPSKTQGQSWPSWHCFEEKVSGCSITTVTAPVIGTLATGWTKEIAVVDAKTCNDLKWFEHWKPVFWWCVYQYQNMKLEHNMRWVPNRWNLLYSTYIAEHDMKPEPTSYKKSWVWFGGASFWSLPASYPKEEKSHRPLFPCPRIMREM